MRIRQGIHGLMASGGKTVVPKERDSKRSVTTTGVSLPESHRVAMVAYTTYLSDARVKRHVANLRSGGYSVDVIALAYAGHEADDRDDHVRYFFPRKRAYRNAGKFRTIYEYLAFTFVTGLILLRNHLLRERYALVHINNMPNFLLFAALPLRLLGVRNILDMHDTMPEIYEERFGVSPSHWVIRLLHFEERLCIRLADFSIAVNRTQLQRLEPAGVRAEQSMLCHNLPDPNVFPERVPAESDGAGFRMVYHGTLSRRLGVDIALRAIALVRERIPGLVYNVIGDGEQRDELVRLTAELGLESVVHFSEGFVSTTQLADLLDGADLAVLPSRENSATRLMLPVKLLEYVRMGIPCIAVRTEAIAGYFDEKMIRFTEAEDPENLADHIDYLFTHPQERKAMAQHAKQFFAAHDFDSERRRYIEAVGRLVGS